MSKPSEGPKPPPMRVAMLWNGTLQGEELVTEAQTIELGDGGLFPLPEGVVPGDRVTVLRPEGVSYHLETCPQMGGFVWLRGTRASVRTLPADVALGPGDYGVVTFGSVSFFFQPVREVRAGAPRKGFRDGALIACFGLSVFMHVVGLLFFFLVAAEEFVPGDDLELDPELVRKFLVVPPPEELPDPSARSGGTDSDDPGLRDRDEQGGKRHEDEQGRVGAKDATAKDTEIAGERTNAVAQKVRGLGLLGVLSGGGDRGAISSALDAPSVNDLIGGLGAVANITGKGSGGTGLRGGGKGGGGTGDGVLFGAGKMGTAVAGGKGLGRGKKGAGASGRKAREVTLALGSKDAKVSGFLSAEQINRVVRANRAAIKYCFENALQRQPNLSGKVHVRWRIDRKGRVSSARVAKSTMGNAKVEGCIVRQVKRWKFPEPDGGEVDVTYPFIFQGG
jgi:TonB family protein